MSKRRRYLGLLARIMSLLVMLPLAASACRSQLQVSVDKGASTETSVQTEQGGATAAQTTTASAPTPRPSSSNVSVLAGASAKIASGYAVVEVASGTSDQALTLHVGAPTTLPTGSTLASVQVEVEAATGDATSVVLNHPLLVTLTVAASSLPSQWSVLVSPLASGASAAGPSYVADSSAVTSVKNADGTVSITVSVHEAGSVISIIDLTPAAECSALGASGAAQSINVTWTNAAGAAGSVIAYAVGPVAPLDCASGTIIAAASIGGASAYAVRALASDQSYAFRLCEVTGAGASSRLSAGITATARTAPNDPVALTAVAPGHGAVSLTWSAPNSGATDYAVAYSAGHVPPVDCQAATLFSSNPNLIVSGLADGGPFAFRVCSRGSARQLSSGATVQASTWQPTPGDVSGLGGVATAVDTIALTWSAPMGGAASYAIAYTAGSVAPASCSAAVTQTAATTINIGGLSAASQYAFRVCAQNANPTADVSAGAVTAATTLQPVPPDVAGPTAAADNSMAITVSWIPTPNLWTVGFKIAYKAGTSAPSTCQTGTIIPAATVGNVSHFQVVGLSDTTYYSFRICSVNMNPVPDVSAGVVATAATPAPALTCDSGTLAGVCTISSVKSVSAAAIVAGGGSLVITGGGAIQLGIAGQTFAIWMLGDVTVASGGSISGNVSLAATNVTVSGSIAADGLGYAGATSSNGSGFGPGGGNGPGNCNSAGGGGHGGQGGSATSGAAGGTDYDTVLGPTTFGSGGGQGCSGSGGNGGGAVKITASGTVTVTGSVEALGGVGTGNAFASGGGAGGAVFLSAQTLAGNGSISASGGAATDLTNAGGGGGGRVAIVTNASTFSGPIVAYGGAGAVAGGAGSVALQVGSLLDVTFDNNGSAGGPSDFDLTAAMTIDQLSIQNGAVVRPIGAQAPGMLLANITVSSGAALASDGLGGSAGVSGGANGGGPSGGVSPSYCGAGGGGGGGGSGGAGASGGAGGSGYGSVAQPSQAGSGGGGGCVNSNGGSGGGALHLSVTGTLAVFGRLSADGIIGGNLAYTGGGGGGGALWLVAGTLTGNGAIHANGGATTGSHPGGGGGGGRVALYAGSSTFTGTTSASGGPGTVPGGAGSVYVKIAAQPALLTFDNGGTSGGSSTFDLSVADTFSTINLKNGAQVAFTGTQAVTLANMNIDATSALDDDGLGGAGAAGGTGATGGGLGGGQGPAYCGAAQGGAHAGSGGGGVSGISATNTNYYDVNATPSTAGSGGGGGCLSGDFGGAGGGLLVLTMSGTLTLAGTISANGGIGLGGAYSGGGGSGGSLLITASAIGGSGTISASGGAASNRGGGGGGGVVSLVGTVGAGVSVLVAGGGAISGGGNGDTGAYFLNAVLQP